MFNIEQHLSPLVKSMFPSFYQEDGENFIAFVEAYFEWLEENYQILVLSDTTGFNEGDTVTQGKTVGKIISTDPDGTNSILVRLDSFDTFRCFDINTVLEEVVSSSGSTSFIISGGRSKRVSPIYWSRHLSNLRDIDTTIDTFILKFKEKYLKNIEFDTSSNKQLLIKNSLDLYRSKGTERSIDLFFRLIYGVNIQVYYPGDDLFKLSNAQWVNPRYLEITSSNRTIELVGKQIKGISSGATAFVERYIKRRVKNSFVDILYVTNSVGQFETDEQIYYSEIFPDLPKIKGSLTNVTIVSGSREFNVGDIVTFSSSFGDHGIARVNGIGSQTGQVDFALVDGGYGYTISNNPSFTADDLKKRTQSIVSEKVLSIDNVNSSNSIATISVDVGGTGYNNTDIIRIRSNIANCIARPITNSTGGILSVAIKNPGAGFYTNNPSSIKISNSTGGTTSGTGAVLSSTSKAPTQYFQYFETITQPIKKYTYNAAANNQAFKAGDNVMFGNNTVILGTGTIIGNDPGTILDANGIVTVGMSNNIVVGTGNTIYLESNNSITANIISVSDNSAHGKIMGIPVSGSINVSAASGTIVFGDEIFQIHPIDGEVVTATVQASTLVGATGTIEFNNLSGVFDPSIPLLVRGKSTTSVIDSLRLNVGVYDIANSFLDSSTYLYTSNSGTTAKLAGISQGTGASFKVDTISDPEIVYLNTDLIGGNNTSNTRFIDLSLNASQFGFPKNPTGNLSATIFSCLNFDSFTIGSIGSLSAIDPGSDYNVDPFILAYQPYLSSSNRRDYVFEIENLSGSFEPGERILQTNTALTAVSLVVGNTGGIEVGMKMKQGTAANGIVSEITAGANTITLLDVSGSFTANLTPITSFSNVSISTPIIQANTFSVTSTAKGIVKSSNSSTISVKRIEYANKWQPTLQVRGSLSGATANIVAVAEETVSLPLGLNAIINSDAVTADGTVTGLEIIDSGFGYADNSNISFVSDDGSRAGSAITSLSGMGTGSGFYKTTKGFLSSSSKIQDGDYYQEYSYEILSRIPLEKYSDMFKKVMHTAGTKFFGGVLLESTIQSPIAAQSIISPELQTLTLIPGNLTLGTIGSTIATISGMTPNSTLEIITQFPANWLNTEENRLVVNNLFLSTPVEDITFTIRETNDTFGISVYKDTVFNLIDYPDLIALVTITDNTGEPFMTANGAFLEI